MTTTVERLPDRTWAVTIAGGPCYLRLTHTAMLQLAAAMRDAGILSQLPQRPRS